MGADMSALDAWRRRGQGGDGGSSHCGGVLRAGVRRWWYRGAQTRDGTANGAELDALARYQEPAPRITEALEPEADDSLACAAIFGLVVMIVGMKDKLLQWATSVIPGPLGRVGVLTAGWWSPLTVLILCLVMAVRIARSSHPTPSDKALLRGPALAPLRLCDAAEGLPAEAATAADHDMTGGGWVGSSMVGSGAVAMGTDGGGDGG